MKTTKKTEDNIGKIKKQSLVRFFVCLVVGLIGMEIANFTIQVSTSVVALIFFMVCFIFGLKYFADAIFSLLQYRKNSPRLSAVITIANILSLVFLTAPGANYLAAEFSLWYYPLFVIVIFELLEGYYLRQFCQLYPQSIRVDKMSGVVSLAFSSMSLASCLATFLSPEFGAQFVNVILVFVAGLCAVISTIVMIVRIAIVLNSKNQDSKVKTLYRRLLAVLLVPIAAITVLFLAGMVLS